jgi:hypothetical protein
MSNSLAGVQSDGGDCVGIDDTAQRTLEDIMETQDLFFIKNSLLGIGAPYEASFSSC